MVGLAEFRSVIGTPRLQAVISGGIARATAEMQTTSTLLEAGSDFVDEILNNTCDCCQISLGD
jgi:hypothetical protein